MPTTTFSLPELLHRIADERAKYQLHMQPPCPAEKITNLAERVKTVFKAELSTEYASFLQIANGVEWDGALFFACENTPRADKPNTTIEGFVEANLSRRDRTGGDRFLFYGDEEILAFVYNLGSQQFESVDRISLDKYRVYESFAAMMWAAFEDRLE